MFRRRTRKTNLIQKKTVRNRNENVKEEQKPVFVREKEKFRGPLLRIFVIEIRKGSTIVIQRQYSTLVHFLQTWYVSFLRNL